MIWPEIEASHERADQSASCLPYMEAHKLARYRHNSQLFFTKLKFYNTTTFYCLLLLKYSFFLNVSQRFISEDVTGMTQELNTAVAILFLNGSCSLRQERADF